MARFSLQMISAYVINEFFIYIYVIYHEFFLFNSPLNHSFVKPRIILSYFKWLKKRPQSVHNFIAATDELSFTFF
jgi:hypothetical protein